jgi:predicted nucleotidyltransferase
MPMNLSIEKYTDKLNLLCKKYSVSELHLFGSAVDGDFTEKSDIDFLVSFTSDLPLLDYADNYFDLIDDLNKLFERDIDLLTVSSLKNPYLISSINANKRLLYAA